MGVNYQGVRAIIRYGPSRNIKLTTRRVVEQEETHLPCALQ